METFSFLLNDFNWEVLIHTGLRILLILVLAWIVLAMIRKVLARVEQKLLKESTAEGEPPSESAKRIETLIRLVRQAVRLVMWLVVGLVVLQELGVDIGPVLAGAGILGLAVGFGAQNLVRDVISGFFIILENQVRVGDVAVINGTGGLVERINFRTIVLRDQKGTVHVFPNGTITTLSNLTQEWSAYVFDLGVAYKENTDAVVEVIREVFAGMRKDETYGPLIIEEPEIFGVDAFADSAVVIKGRIKTRPIRQWMVGREFLRRIKLAFDERGIEIPFPHRSLYIGEASKPLAVEILEKAGSREKV
jgi:moderate conductance mechanosensitive channel